MSLNESKDTELTKAVNDTIQKIKESKYDYYNLYKLKNLNAGL
jgi:ABC-type amino acid transport substrate-binding protein